MFYEEMTIKQGLPYISFWPLRILYNSKFIIMATYSGTNAVGITTVHCTWDKYANTKSVHASLDMASKASCENVPSAYAVNSSNIILFFRIAEKRFPIDSSCISFIRIGLLIIEKQTNIFAVPI